MAAVATALRNTPAAPRSVAVEVRNVSHAFDLRGSHLPVLDSITLTVAAGEFAALLGPSGCGKSTLLRLIFGLDQPTSGTITADGALVAGPDSSRILVFQDPTLFPWTTVWRNVATGLDARGVLKRQRSRVDDALKLVGLTAFGNAYPHQLSGGMAQRAALARALVNDPALLLARRAARQARFADPPHAAKRASVALARQKIYRDPRHARCRRSRIAVVARDRP